MSAEARYFRVGLFVFLGAIGIGSCAVILGGGDWFQEKELVETYFDEPVAGLEVGSAVKFRGVPLGSVKLIEFVIDHYDFTSESDELRYGQLVRVVMELTPQEEVSEQKRRENIGQLIAKGLRLRLTTQGLTGVAYIAGDLLDPGTHRPMEIAWQPEHLYVPSAPSTIRTISTAAERIFRRLENADIEGLVENANRLLVSLEEAVQQLDTERLGEQGSALIADLRATSRSLRIAVEGTKLEEISADARTALEDLSAALVRIRRLVDRGRYDVEVTLDNVRVASENLRDLTATLREQPSLAVRSGAPAESSLGGAQ